MTRWKTGNNRRRSAAFRVRGLLSGAWVNWTNRTRPGSWSNPSTTPEKIRADIQSVMDALQ